MPGFTKSTDKEAAEHGALLRKLLSRELCVPLALKEMPVHA